MRLGIIIVYTVVCFMVAGCQGTKQHPPQYEAMQVILDGTDTFPEQMVGIWASEKHGWIIRFEKNGYIKKIRHQFTRRNLIAGETSTIPLIGGGKGILEPGPWALYYSADNRELTVEVALKNINYDMVGTGLITGSSQDFFTGVIPEKGETQWRTQWVSFVTYYASTEGKEYENYKLPSSEGDEIKGELVFNKIDISALEKK